MTITSRPTCLSALTATALLLALLTALSFAPVAARPKPQSSSALTRPRESDGGAERSPGQPHLSASTADRPPSPDYRVYRNSTQIGDDAEHELHQ